jgi:hypothetical protein
VDSFRGLDSEISLKDQIPSNLRYFDLLSPYRSIPVVGMSNRAQGEWSTYSVSSLSGQNDNSPVIATPLLHEIRRVSSPIILFQPYIRPLLPASDFRD